MNKKTKIGLLFGSFNPIHIGHIFMGEMALESGIVDEVWFVVSPASPYKMSTGELADTGHRKEMVVRAISYNPKFAVNTTEFDLPQPSYTSTTLAKLKKENPEHDFYIICGTDVYVDIPGWIGGKEVIDAVSFLVYPRNTTTNYAPEEMVGKTVHLNGVPSLEISSTFLRKQIKNNKVTKHLLTESVIDYIKQNNLYK